MISNFNLNLNPNWCMMNLWTTFSHCSYVTSIWSNLRDVSSRTLLDGLLDELIHIAQSSPKRILWTCNFIGACLWGIWLERNNIGLPKMWKCPKLINGKTSSIWLPLGTLKSIILCNYNVFINAFNWKASL